MSQLHLITPVKILLPSDDERVKRFLTYTDKSVGFQISKMKKNYRWAKSNPETFNAHLDKLKAEQKKCLLFYNEEGPYTYSGFARDLSSTFKWEFRKPDHSHLEGTIPWNEIPPTLRPYQKEAVDALIAAGHGAIQLSTGSGKSLCIFNLLKHYPVKTLLITPSTNITRQLYEEATKFFGAKYVGLYADGKKQYNKLFTIANGQSITRIKPGSKEWEELSKCQMLISDESQCIPTETFEHVACGIAEMAPLRFFVSATQTRTDGSEMRLQGLIGPIVYRKEFKDLVAEGYLKDVKVRVFPVPFTGGSETDPKAETRRNLYLNGKVNKMVADLTEKFIRLSDRQVVIMIEEYDQFLQLRNYLTVPYEFVHGPVSKEIKEKLPEKYWDSDSARKFQEFNEGKIKCLIGTTAVGVGVDLRPVGALFYLQGGTSEIKVKQSVGRGTRPVKHKDLYVIDFDIKGSVILERHLRARTNIYKELASSITFME